MNLLRLCASAPLRLCASAPLRLCASAPLRLCALAAVLTLAACDGGSGPVVGGHYAANSAAEAIQLTKPNVRATLALDLTQITSGKSSTPVTISVPTENYRLHSGTTFNGALAFDLDALNPPKHLEDEPRTFRIRNGTLTIADATGKLLPGGATGVHSVLGTQDSDPMTVMDGLVADALPAVGSTVTRDGGTATVTRSTSPRGGGTAEVWIVTQPGEPEAAPIEQRRVYQQRNGKFVMSELKTIVTETDGGVETRSEMRMQFANVTWPQRIDAETMAAPGGGWGEYANSTGPCTPEMQVCPPGSFPGPDTPPDTSGAPGGGVPPLCNGSLVEGGANLVYVHGINANGTAWGDEFTNNAVRGKTRCDLRVGSDIAPALTAGGLRGLGHHHQQGAQLTDITTSAST